MIRAMVGRAECETARVKDPHNRMGKGTCVAFVFVLATALWLSYKEAEPTLFPVVENFVITKAEDVGGRAVLIYGSFEKTRNCEFVEIVAYSGPVFVRVRFLDDEGSYYPHVTRRPRMQNFGPWKLEPKTAELELYVTHKCWTGTVTTQLFKGALVI